MWTIKKPFLKKIIFFFHIFKVYFPFLTEDDRGFVFVDDHKCVFFLDTTFCGRYNISEIREM